MFTKLFKTFGVAGGSSLSRYHFTTGIHCAGFFKGAIAMWLQFCRVNNMLRQLIKTYKTGVDFQMETSHSPKRKRLQ